MHKLFNKCLIGIIAVISLLSFIMCIPKDNGGGDPECYITLPNTYPTLMKKIGSDVIVVAFEKNPYAWGIWKNGTRIGESSLTSYSNWTVNSTDICYDGGNYYIAGWYRDNSNNKQYAVYWTMGSGTYTTLGNTSGINSTDTTGQSILRMESPDDYIIWRSDEGNINSVFISGSKVTLTIPGGNTLVNALGMAKNGATILISGTYKDAGDIKYGVIWNSNGSVNQDINYTLPNLTDYSNASSYHVFGEHGFILHSDGSYVLTARILRTSSAYYEGYIKKDAGGNITFTEIIDNSIGRINRGLSYDGTDVYAGGYTFTGTGDNTVYKPVYCENTATNKKNMDLPVCTKSAFILGFTAKGTNPKAVVHGIDGNKESTNFYYDGTEYGTEFSKGRAQSTMIKNNTSNNYYETEKLNSKND